MDGDASVRTKDRKQKTAEVERLHEKTFRAWANSRLKKRELNIENSLAEAFHDGLMLIKLMEVLTGDDCEDKVHKNPAKDIHKLENITIAISFIQKYVKVNVASKDIMEGNMKVILGLIWRLILTFQVDQGDEAGKENMTAAQRNRLAKQKLLKWCQDTTKDYPNVQIQDFGESWYDGMGFCALVHAIDETLLDFNSLNPANVAENLERAFALAEEHLDIPRLLDVEDILAEDAHSRPDEQCFMTYLSAFPVALLQKRGDASIRKKELDAAAEEARKKADEEARRKAEEEANRRVKEAEESARRQAEEEARKREAELKANPPPEEEARRKAELEAIASAKKEAAAEAKAKAEKKAKKEEERRRREEEERKKLADMDDAKKRTAEEERERQFEEERRRLQEENRRLQEALLANKAHQLIGKLYVTLIEARNLRKKVDAYATLFLERQKERSKRKKKTKTPKWGDEFEFYVSEADAALEVTILDRNWLFADDFVGYVKVSVADLEDGVELSRWFPLQSSKGKKAGKDRGELHLSLTYRKDTLEERARRAAEAEKASADKKGGKKLSKKDLAKAKEEEKKKAAAEKKAKAAPQSPKADTKKAQIESSEEESSEEEEEETESGSD